MMKTLLAVMLLYTCALDPLGGVSAQNSADLAWKQVQQWNRDADECSLDGITERTAYQKWYVETEERWRYFYWLARLIREHRRQGIEFWNRFPHDPRRFAWLRTVKMEAMDPDWKDLEQGARAFAIGRYQDIVYDVEAQAQWERQYLIMRSEYMSAPDEIARNKDDLRGFEFRDAVYRVLYRKASGDLVMRRLDMAYPVLDFADRLSGGSDQVRWLYESMADDPESASVLATAMKWSRNPDVRWFGAGYLEVVRLRKAPLELRLSTLEGGLIDTKALRGKAVLIDMWANSCAGCIAKMPRIQEVYRRYRDQGFEVVGVWWEEGSDAGKTDNGRDLQAAALKILRKQGATWSNGILKARELKAFQEKYALHAVPVTWLLDKNGVLVTTDVREEKLESEVRKLLGLPLRAGTARVVESRVY